MEDVEGYLQEQVGRGMGFHDMEVFNKALLAKQGWRIVQNLNSILTRALQGKYYPSCSFLEASLGAACFLCLEVHLGDEGIVG